MAQGDQMNREVLTIDDLRYTAYAYQQAVRKEKGNEDDLLNIFNEMDADRDKRIFFGEFKIYMNNNGYTLLGADELFFNRLACQRGYLKYCDVVTLLYIINSGRPYCNMCRHFIQGSFFTCVSCFEREKEYHHNLCPNCYGSNDRHGHPHKEFVDPLSLLRLIAKRGLVSPTSTTPSVSNQHSHSASSSSNANIVQQQMNRRGVGMELMRFAVEAATVGAAFAQFCTIM